jgi:hypothetical protein
MLGYQVHKTQDRFGTSKTTVGEKTPEGWEVGLNCARSDFAAGEEAGVSSISFR